MKAVHVVLATGTDLTHSGAGVDVLGRLLALADFHDSPAVLDRFSLIFNDDERVTSADLWVMTSILAQYISVSWFRNDLLVPPDSNSVLRRRIRDLILRRWPQSLNIDLPTAAAEGSGTPVDPELGRRWKTLIKRGAAPSVNDPGQLITQLLVTAGLNQAAARLAARQNAIAEAILNEVEAMLLDDEVEDASSQKPSPHRMPRGITRRLTRHPIRPRIGQTIGPDGPWAEAYERVGRNTQEKMNWLRSLRVNAGSDLGPIDAGVLVREAFRAPRLEVRSVAQSVLVESFAMGPNIAMEMLDQFPDAPRVEDVSDLIQRLTGRVLPGSRDDHWILESRLALLDHVLALTDTDQQNLDLGAAILTESYLDRLAALKRERSISTAASTPDRALELLIEAWRLRAAVVVVSNPVPADLTSLDRRRTTRVSLAQGPIQQYVAQQLALLDLLIYITVAEQPLMREPALIVLHDAFEQRSRALSSLQQALITERALLAIWGLRLSIPNHDKHEPMS